MRNLILPAMIPDLRACPVSCGSWVIVSRVTGEAVLETYSRKTAEAVNHAAYRVLTAYDYLCGLNQARRA